MGNVTDVVFCLQIRFQDDSIDETSEVEAALVGSQTTHSADSGNSSSESPPDKPTPLDVSVLDLAGDHVRPLVPEPPAVPPDVATSINEVRSYFNHRMGN